MVLCCFGRIDGGSETQRGSVGLAAFHSLTEKQGGPHEKSSSWQAERAHAAFHTTYEGPLFWHKVMQVMLLAHTAGLS